MAFLMIFYAFIMKKVQVYPCPLQIQYFIIKIKEGLILYLAKGIRASSYDMFSLHVRPGEFHGQVCFG